MDLFRHWSQFTVRPRLLTPCILPLYQYYTWQDKTRNCVLCLLLQRVIICIEVKFGHHVLFNLVGNPWFHSCGPSSSVGRKMFGKQGYRPRPQTLTAATKNISNVSAHQLFVCLCVQSAAKKYHHIFLKRYFVRMLWEWEVRGGALCSDHP